MARQGATETMTGAAPIAVSQLQPKAKPDPTIARPSMPRAYRLPIQDRSAPRSNSTREEGWQHTAGIDIDGVAEAGRSTLSICVLSMVSLLQETVQPSLARIGKASSSQ